MCQSNAPCGCACNTGALFRVFADRHTGVALRVRNMNDGVARIVQQAQRDRVLLRAA